MTPRVLITNDDGIDSPGLATLARCSVELGWDTVVAAPAEESSGTSAGITAAARDRQVVVRQSELAGLSDVETYAVEASPGLIALIACHDGFGDRPTLLLSGVNRGANVGRAVLHSGTVGAALTAGINGVPAVAVSLDVGLAEDVELRWDNASRILAGLLPAVARLAGSPVLNVNVPNTEQVGPLRWARLATYGQAQTKISRADPGTIEVTTIEVEGELEEGTDAALLAAGHATITPLYSVTEDDDLIGSGLLAD
ncbi:5'/3'-nucleotidase SurE [Kibdelosporangium persicum]|uniref:5'-nucleotidase n=1 Tax=Kibdelosporangium persicum TaxID=2698649 RepID=A0ABX2F2I8_9PSEU|nr:5'/3'-nucleotidase SurE [Kibdelosporangium persicum]NRN65210.1 Stationary phase survival protein SurE [Kibdelosporangium persicum]